MKKLLLVSRSAFFLFSSAAAFAAAPPQGEVSTYFTLQKPVIKEVAPTWQEVYSDLGIGTLNPGSASPISPLATAPPAPSSLGQTADLGGIDWNLMMEIGQKIIQIIEAGKPVANITNTSTSVVPGGLTSWQQLSGWQAPVTKYYTVSVANGFNATVIELRLKVSANYGGGLDGRGKYLANVNVVPTSVYVGWGFTCNVWNEHQDPLNIGTSAEPVAGLGITIRYNYGSPFSLQNGAQDYFLTGTGQIQLVQ